MAMQEALISPVMKTKKKQLRSNTDLPPGTKSKKLSRKKRLQNLQRQVYDLEGVLTRTKRTGTTLLPWEEIALAFKEDTLDQVRDNRSLKRQLQRQEHIYHVLRAWVQDMLPPQRILNPHAETWRHSQLIQGDDEIRRIAQTWIVQHAYHNTDRVMATSAFPDSNETQVEIDVTVDDDGGLFQVRGVVQYTLPLPLEAASDMYWIAENSFTQYRLAAPPTLIMQDERCRDTSLRYNRQLMSIRLARQSIRNHSLHGQFRTPDRTTVVWRTILRDEAFPEEDARAWVLDAHLWTVAEPCGPNATRFRTVYTMGHPCTVGGRMVTAEEMATEFHLRRGPTDVQRQVREFLTSAHVRQRQLFFDYLTCLMRLSGVPPK